MGIKYNYVVVEGNIGAGKTSLVNKLGGELSARIILEQFADNPFLPKFYEDPDRYAFPLELSFIAERFNQLKTELKSLDMFHQLVIADYYFSKSLIFARSTLPEDMYKLYRQIFYIIYQSLPKPQLYVYLYKNVDVLLANIKKRGRSYEQGISREYLENIQQGYFEFFRQYGDKNRILIIDTTNLDFVNIDKDYDAVKAVIFEKEHPLGITRIEL